MSAFSNQAPPSEATPRLLSAQGAAKYLGVPYTSLRDWALRGKDLDHAIDAWKERAPE
jgi:hypothetical protein